MYEDNMHKDYVGTGTMSRSSESGLLRNVVGCSEESVSKGNSKVLQHTKKHFKSFSHSKAALPAL